MDTDPKDKTAIPGRDAKRRLPMEGNIMERNNLSGIPTAVLMQGRLATQTQKDLSEGKYKASEIIDDPEKKVERSTPEDINDDINLSEFDGLSEFEEGSDTNPDRSEAFARQEKARLDTLQGMFDKYKRDSLIEKKSLLDEIGRLKAIIDNQNSIISKFGVRTEGSSSTDDDDLLAGLDDDEVTVGKPNKAHRLDPKKYSDFGDEIVDMASMVNALYEENQELKKNQAITSETIQTDKATEAYNLFKVKMSQLVNKHWEVINYDPLFTKWLDDNPDIKEDVNAYGQALDYTRAARVFNLFIKETGYIVPDKPQRKDLNIEEEIIPDLNSTNSGQAEGAQETNKGFTVISRKQYQVACQKRALGQMTEERFNKIQKNFNISIRKGLA